MVIICASNFWGLATRAVLKLNAALPPPRAGETIRKQYFSGQNITLTREMNKCTESIITGYYLALTQISTKEPNLVIIVSYRK